MPSINQARAKRLGEILKDQQEPFTLELYLLEKGYKDSPMCLNKPTTGNKKGVILPACTKILRAVFSKLESINLRIKHPYSRTRGFGTAKIEKGITQEHAERLSSFASSTTVFQSCYESDIEDENIFMQKCQSLTSSKALSIHRNLPFKDEAENKQQSPISVLEVAALYDETSPVHNMQQNIKTTKEAATTTKTKRFTDEPVSLESIQRRNQTSVEETNKSTISSEHSSRYKKIKMALMQSKQLLFDCTREVIEKQILKTNSTKSHRFQQFVRTEDIGKLLRENIWTWNRTNSAQMLPNLDEWSSFELQRKEAAKEIGDFIFEDIISVTVAELLQPS